MLSRALVRRLALLLLMLALSPLTAPFSSINLHDLLDGPGPHDSALLQAKTSAEKLPAALPPAVGTLAPSRLADVAHAPARPATGRGAPLSPPLRR